MARNPCFLYDHPSMFKPPLADENRNGLNEEISEQQIGNPIKSPQHISDQSGAAIPSSDPFHHVLEHQLNFSQAHPNVFQKNL